MKLVNKNLKIENVKGVSELNYLELRNIEGGWIHILASIATVVYVLGEIAEQAGNAYRNK